MTKNTSSASKSTGSEETLLQMPRKRAMGWIVIFCFVSVWIFLLGIIVGRGMAPVQFDINEFKHTIEDLRREIIAKQLQAAKQETITLKQESDLEFHEDVKQLQPDTNVSFDARKPVQDTSPEKTGPPKHKTRTFTNKKSLLAKTEKQPAKPSNPEPVKAGATEKKLTIQIASLRDSNEADQMVAALQKKGIPAYKTVGILSANNVWYRVRAGNFGTRQESQAMMAKIKKEHKGAFLLTR
jgi:cell division protein FtsN